MISLEFLATSLVVVLMPGTGVIYTVSTVLLRGRRAGFYASLGCTLGILPHLAATIVGAAALLQASALAFQALKWAGAAYLLWLAVHTWRDRSAFALADEGDGEGAGAGAGAHSTGPTPRSRGHRAQVRDAFVLNILNPKLTIFFLAYLPQFVNAAAGPPWVPLLVLSAVFMAMTLGVFVAYGLVAHGFRRHLVASARARQGLRRSFAMAFVALGARLAFSER